jgi:hypothetical protein
MAFAMLLGLGLLACQDTTPAAIDLTGPDGPIRSAEPQRLQAAVVNAAGESLEAQQFGWLSGDPARLSVNAQGHFICHKEGAVDLTATNGDLTATLRLHCAVVAELKAPEKISMMVGAEPWAPPIQAFGHGGGEISDAPIELSVADTRVAEVREHKLVGLAQGTTTLSVVSGGASLELPVTVIEVGSIDVNSPVLVALGRTVKPIYTVRDLAGNKVDVVVDIESGDSGVITVIGGKISGMQYGKTDLVFRAGKASRKVTGGVLQIYDGDAMSIGDGNAVSLTFSKPGTYIILVSMKASDGSRFGVSAKWSGADCKGHSESQNFFLSCEVSSTAKLILTNPSVLGIGPTAVGSIRWVRAPVSAESFSQALLRKMMEKAAK